MKRVLLPAAFVSLGCSLAFGQQVPRSDTIAATPPAPLAATTPTMRILDPMDDAASWKVVTPEGVRLTVHEDEGLAGKCLRLDYEFVSGGGYCIIQKALPTTLPANYEFAFHVRGNGPDNNLEFKLLDKAGDSVWWVNRRAFEWPATWTRLSNKKRKFEFAWGPSAGAPLTEISKIEFAIASSSGGKGSVWLDELVMRELPVRAVDAIAAPKFTASSEADPDHGAVRAGDTNPDTEWHPRQSDEQATLTLDLGSVREFGGVDVRWSKATAPEEFSLESSDDGVAWSLLAPARSPHDFETGVVARSLVITPEAEARYVRIGAVKPRTSTGFPWGIRDVVLKAPEFSASTNAVIEHLAAEAPRGQFPKYFCKEASYWTVVGAADDGAEILMNEEGQIEAGKRGFMLDPLIFEPRLVRAWADATCSQSLAEDRIPLPTVTRAYEAYDLLISPVVKRLDNVTWLFVRYDLRNKVPNRAGGQLALTVRPYQVNPTYQWLNTPGGVSSITGVEPLPGSTPADTEPGRIDGLRIATSKRNVDVFALTPADSSRAWRFGTMDIPQIGEGEGEGVGLVGLVGLDVEQTLADPQGLAAGGLLFGLGRSAKGETGSVVVAVALEGEPHSPPFKGTALEAMAWFDAQRNAAAAEWSEREGRCRITVPISDRWISDTFASQIAYILINRDGPALQPGSRSYERSWARDGSLTSAALISCGHEEEAKQWIDWFGSHQFENGKIPCVVDSRGPDPVPEHDSHGEYIWAVANYYRHTHDAAFLKLHYPRVQKAVEYIESLRAQRKTNEYLDESSPKRAMYGLVPESISHEGYSAKPMHSYWDDFFVLLGLKEAAYIAEQSGDDQYAQAYAKLAAEFRICLYDSMKRVFASHNIDYVPGCVELADFDSTSTTIALFPCDEQEYAPKNQLKHTFDRYWEFAKGRMNGDAWEAFTPYELRHVGAFVRLGEPERAYELLTWFHQFQRPQGWNHWAEVVWHDPKTPKFIGDMPHTWVGSDYLNSVLSMFEYEHAQSLVLFAGVPKAWVDSGEPLGIEGVHTSYGKMSLTMQRDGNVIHAHAIGDVRSPEGGFVFRKPPGAQGEDQIVRSLPADVQWEIAK